MKPRPRRGVWERPSPFLCLPRSGWEEKVKLGWLTGTPRGLEGSLTFSVSSSWTALVKGVGVGRPSRLSARKKSRYEKVQARARAWQELGKGKRCAVLGAGVQDILPQPPLDSSYKSFPTSPRSETEDEGRRVWNEHD